MNEIVEEGILALVLAVLDRLGITQIAVEDAQAAIQAVLKTPVKLPPDFASKVADLRASKLAQAGRAVAWSQDETPTEEEIAKP